MKQPGMKRSRTPWMVKARSDAAGPERQAERLLQEGHVVSQHRSKLQVNDSRQSLAASAA